MSTLGPDDPTPNPEALTLESLNSQLQRLRNRILELERKEIGETISEHEKRLDEHDTRFVQNEERIDLLQSQWEKTQAWLSGIEKKTVDTNAVVHRIEALLRGRP